MALGTAALAAMVSCLIYYFFQPDELVSLSPHAATKSRRNGTDQGAQLSAPPDEPPKAGVRFKARDTEDPSVEGPDRLAVMTIPFRCEASAVGNDSEVVALMRISSTGDAEVVGVGSIDSGVLSGLLAVNQGRLRVAAKGHPDFEVDVVPAAGGATTCSATFTPHQVSIAGTILDYDAGGVIRGCGGIAEVDSVDQSFLLTVQLEPPEVCNLVFRGDDGHVRHIDVQVSADYTTIDF